MTTKERIRSIQRRLGLAADGIIGPATLSALERLIELRDQATPGETAASLRCSLSALAWIVAFEISSEAYYNRSLRRPYWPGGASGVTIGIGYDLGYCSAAQCRRDWGGRIPDVDVTVLEGACRLKAADAQRAVGRASLRALRVPIDPAREVFYVASLPHHAQRCREAYPGVEQLPADAQTALLSLVFNRGTRKSGSRRREMKALESLVRGGDLEGIAAEIRKMKRLWEDTQLTGLLTRRDREARLVEESQRDYEPDVLVSI
ncbi:MAG: peptidoglycan-binding protein [Pseudomonadota bacterium]